MNALGPTDAYLSAAPRDNDLPDIRSEQWHDQLRRYRKLLEAAWSRTTIHSSYLANQPVGPASRGQCGVSSVWLIQELRRNFKVEATYCYGDLIFTTGSSAPVSHHCWVEIGPENDPNRIIIDLTFDEADQLDDPGTLRHVLRSSAPRPGLSVTQQADARQTTGRQSVAQVHGAQRRNK